jgi:hypothetical protein
MRIRPLVNVESEQLKAIVRQGRRLRKAEGAKEAEPEVQIFAPEKPPQVDALSSIMKLEPRHHLTQHSEYKYEKEVPAVPFYLHPPPVPHPSPELFQVRRNMPGKRRAFDRSHPSVSRMFPSWIINRASFSSPFYFPRTNSIMNQ